MAKNALTSGILLIDTPCNRKCSTAFGCIGLFWCRTAYQACNLLVFSGIEIMGALIFDFDGVIADSEAIANTVLAEIVTGLGHSTTLDQALARYSGRRWDEAMAEIEAAIGKPLPADFSGELKRATLDRFRTDLKEVSGAAKFHQTFFPHPPMHRVLQFDRSSAAVPFGVGIGGGVRQSRLQCRYGGARKTSS